MTRALAAAVAVQAETTRAVEAAGDVVRDTLQLATAADLVGELNRLRRLASKLIDAAERWLVDPDNPDAFTLDLRAPEITAVIVGAGPGVRRVALDRLLEEVNGKLGDKGRVVAFETRTKADPRMLLARYLDSSRGLVELIARCLGTLVSHVSVALEQRPAIALLIGELGAILAEKLDPWPAAAQAVDDGIGEALASVEAILTQTANEN